MTEALCALGAWNAQHLDASCFIPNELIMFLLLILLLDCFDIIKFSLSLSGTMDNARIHLIVLNSYI